MKVKTVTDYHLQNVENIKYLGQQRKENNLIIVLYWFCHDLSLEAIDPGMIMTFVWKVESVMSPWLAWPCSPVSSISTSLCSYCRNLVTRIVTRNLYLVYTDSRFLECVLLSFVSSLSKSGHYRVASHMMIQFLCSIAYACAGPVLYFIDIWNMYHM